MSHCFCFIARAQQLQGSLHCNYMPDITMNPPACPLQAPRPQHWHLQQRWHPLCCPHLTVWEQMQLHHRLLLQLLPLLLLLVGLCLRLVLPAADPAQGTAGPCGTTINIRACLQSLSRRFRTVS